MADIEEADGDVGRAREWMSRAMRAAPDPAWTADGVVSDRWQPVSPVTGRLDAFQWKVPVAEIGVERPVIEPESMPVAEATAIETAAEPAPETTAPVPEARADAANAGPAPIPPKPAEKPVEPVIPVVHAPDDPGPDGAADSEPVPEPTSSSGGTWRRLRRMFG